MGEPGPEAWETIDIAGIGENSGDPVGAHFRIVCT